MQINRGFAGASGVQGRDQEALRGPLCLDRSASEATMQWIEAQPHSAQQPGAHTPVRASINGMAGLEAIQGMLDNLADQLRCDSLILHGGHSAMLAKAPMSVQASVDGIGVARSSCMARSLQSLHAHDLQHPFSMPSCGCDCIQPHIKPVQNLPKACHACHKERKCQSALRLPASHVVDLSISKHASSDYLP